MFSMANLGELNYPCTYDTLDTTSSASLTFELYCSYGSMFSLQAFGLETFKNSTTCKVPTSIQLNGDCQISTDTFTDHQSDIVYNAFEDTCYGQSNCTLTIETGELPSACTANNNYKIFLVAAC